MFTSKPLAPLAQVKKMLVEDRADFREKLTAEFKTQSELQTIAANLKTTMYLIYTIGILDECYAPFAHKYVNTLANMMSTGFLDEDYPILLTAAGRPDSLLNLLPESLRQSIGEASYVEYLYDEPVDNARAIVDKFYASAINSMKPVKSRITLCTINVNMMTILDLIAHMASRANAFTIDSMHRIAHLAGAIANLNSNLDLVTITDLDNYIESLAQQEKDFLVSNPNARILSMEDSADLSKIHTIKATGDVFMLSANGDAYLNGKLARFTRHVKFTNNARSVEFQFGKKLVYLMYNGDIYINFHGDYRL